MLPAQHEAVLLSESGSGERAPVPLEAGLIGLRLDEPTRQVGDPTVAELQKVSNAELDPGGVVDGNAVARLLPAAHDHERHALRAQLLYHRALAAELQHEDACRPLLEKRLDALALPRRAAVGVAERRRVAGPREPLLDELRELRVERVCEIADEDADGGGTAPDEAAGHGVRAVADACDRLEHSPPRSGGGGGAADHVRDGRLRHAGGLGDVQDRGLTAAPVHGATPSRLVTNE